MLYFISILSLVFAVSASATKKSCDPLLDAAVVPRRDLPRVAVARVGADLTPRMLASGAVLTREGREEVFVIDAVAARANGEAFVASLIDAADSPGVLAWRADVTSRILGYAEFGARLDDLATAVGRRGVIEGVRDAFFTRSFSWKGRRVMLVSLRRPAPVEISPAPVLSPGTAVDRPLRRAPANAWFALPPAEGRSRYLFWEVDGLSAPSSATGRNVSVAKITARVFEKSLVPVADFERAVSGSAVVHVPAYNLQYLNTGSDPGTMLFEIHYEDRPDHQALRIVQQYDAPLVDLLIHSAEFVSDHLEPAQRVSLPRAHLDVFVPAAVWHTELDQSLPHDAIEKALHEITASNEGLVRNLREMPVGGRLTVATSAADPKPLARRKRTAGPFSMIFTKDSAGRVHLLAWIRSAPL